MMPTVERKKGNKKEKRKKVVGKNCSALPILHYTLLHGEDNRYFTVIPRAIPLALPPSTKERSLKTSSSHIEAPAHFVSAKSHILAETLITPRPQSG
jgi:hypothetical protein